MPADQLLSHHNQGSRSIPQYLTRWTLSIGAGAAVYFGIARSPIAALVVTWYAFVSIGWLLALLSPPRRGVALVYVLPRVVCTAVALGASFQTGLSSAQAIAASFAATAIMESAVHLLVRLVHPAALDRARMALDIPSRSTREGPARMGVGRTTMAVTSALLFAFVFSATAYVFFARQVAFDTRFHLTALHTSGAYDSLVQRTSDAALDAARSRSAGARRAVDDLSKEDVRLAQQLILPEPWTSAVLADSIDATLVWLESDDGRSTPALSLPLEDVKRHIKDAASVVLDRYLSSLPQCTPDEPPGAYCRPEGTSLTAFAAAFKPDNMTVADKAFSLIPAELDLATATTMFPGPFRKPLAYLARARQAVHTLDRTLPVAGTISLALLAVTWLLAAYSPSGSLRWIGATLLGAALGAWATGHVASAIAPQAAARWAQDLFYELPGSTSEAALRLVQQFVDAARARLWPWALTLAGLGLAQAITGLVALPSARWTRRLSSQQAVQVAVFVLAAGSLLWAAYLHAGRRMYDAARQADRRGQPAEACTLYQQIERRYPLEVNSFVRRTRKGRRECQLYLDAESAYRSADYGAAVQRYEAFLLSNPAISIRYEAQAHLLDALFAWGRLLDDAGERERALDRYRFVRDSALDRGGHLAVYGQDVRIHKTIADLYLAWGDELLAAGDPQAALGTYRRILHDAADPGLWDQAESRMLDAYCAWIAQLQEQAQNDRAAGLCIELSLEFPSTAADRCVPCSP